MSSQSEQFDGPPTGRYWVIPRMSSGPHQPTVYRQEILLKNKRKHWRILASAPRTLYSGNAPEVTIRAANVAPLARPVLLCVVVQKLGAGVGVDVPTIYPATFGGTTTQTYRQVCIPVAAGPQGALIVFGIVEDGKVTKIVCTDDPEIQNGVG